MNWRPDRGGQAVWDNTQPRRAMHFDSRSLTVVFGLALLALVACVYLAAPETYLWAMRIWVPETLPVPFADAAYIVSQLGCWREGADVYVSNPCELYHRAFAYPPLWLRLWFLPSSPRSMVPFALAIDTGFIVSLVVLPRVRRAGDMLLLWAALASSATGYGLERGNVDLLIFVLAAFATATAGRGLPLRVAGYAAITFAALLKLFPVFLLAQIARERSRVALPLALAALLCGLAAVWCWHDQWIAMFPNIPGPEYSSDGPGGRKLPEGLFILIDGLARQLGSTVHLDEIIPRRAAIAILFAALLLPALFASLRLARGRAFSHAIRLLSPRESVCLTSGALLFCGCFAAGTSIAYREVFLLFAIPALLSLRHRRLLPLPVRWTAVLTIPLMWASFPALLFDLAFGPLGRYGGPLPTFAFWLAREILWWWLFIVMAAGLFRIAAQYGVITIDRVHPDQLASGGGTGLSGEAAAGGAG